MADLQKKKAIISWSGGKDCCMALARMLDDPEITVTGLFSTFSTTFGRVSMHGVRENLMEAQAASLGLPLFKKFLPPMPAMDVYENAMLQEFENFRAEGITHVIYGDIFLEDLRAYREALLARAGLTGLFPLWNIPTAALISDFIESGYRAIVVVAQDHLQGICGKVIDSELVEGLPSTTDPCGELGEFHTFVFNGPILQQELDFKTGATVYKTFPSITPGSALPSGCWYTDLLLNT